MAKLDERLERIEGFKELKDGWYEPGAGEAIERSSIEFAKKMCRLLYETGDTEFGIFPAVEGGGVLFEWDDRSLEICGFEELIDKLPKR